ncbi:hypothetical protein ACFL4T_13365 [candidate division KSB1 bacterium]
MKLSRLLMISLFLNVNCISMMETAKINKGFKYNVNFELTRINPEISEWTVENQNKKVVGLGVRISKGKFYGSDKNVGAELGVDLGMLFYPTVVGVTVYNSDEDFYKIHYYPTGQNNLITPKFFAKFGIMQNKTVSYAVKIEMAGEKFASGGLIVSKSGKKRDFYAGAKLFNRFIKSAEKKMFDENYGQYFCIGMEIPTNQRFVQSFKFIHWVLEAGIVNNLWYKDKPAFLLSAGLTLK